MSATSYDRCSEQNDDGHECVRYSGHYGDHMAFSGDTWPGIDGPEGPEEDA